MAAVKKMLGRADADYIVALMRLMETQSKKTISLWATCYAKEVMLPIYQKKGVEIKEIKAAFDMAEGYFKKEKSLAEMKSVSKQVIAIARQQDLTPAAQAAARAISAAFSSFSTPTSALGMVFYAAASVAYDREGTEQTPQRYEEIAEQEAKNLYQRLQEIAVEGEKKPAKLNWNC